MTILFFLRFSTVDAAYNTLWASSTAVTPRKPQERQCRDMAEQVRSSSHGYASMKTAMESRNKTRLARLSASVMSFTVCGMSDFNLNTYLKITLTTVIPSSQHQEALEQFSDSIQFWRAFQPQRLNWGEEAQAFHWKNKSLSWTMGVGWQGTADLWKSCWENTSDPVKFTAPSPHPHHFGSLSLELSQSPQPEGPWQRGTLNEEKSSNADRVLFSQWEIIDSFY